MSASEFGVCKFSTRFFAVGVVKTFEEPDGSAVRAIYVMAGAGDKRAEMESPHAVLAGDVFGEFDASFGKLFAEG